LNLRPLDPQTSAARSSLFVNVRIVSNATVPLLIPRSRATCAIGCRSPGRSAQPPHETPGRTSFVLRHDYSS